MDDDKATRIRLAYTAIVQALPPFQAWLVDSLMTPRGTVESKQHNLVETYSSDREEAATVFGAAWLLDTLARTYVPAVRRSGLLDSSRVVRLASVAEQFVDEVGEIPPCTSPEVARWRAQAKITSGALADARKELTEVRAAIRSLTLRASEAWAIAQHSRNFFYEQVVGPYLGPTDVIVTLHWIPLGRATNERATDANMVKRWALYFH